MRPFPEPYQNGEYVSFFKRLKIYFSKNESKTESIDNSISTRIENTTQRFTELEIALKHELLSMDEAAEAFSRLGR